MEKKEDWVVTNKRFVAFLDIMGFRDMVLRMPHDEITIIFNEIYQFKDSGQQVLNSAADEGKQRFLGHRDKVKSISFSDSILFISADDSWESLEAISICLSFFISYPFVRAVPMKGALSFGTLTADFERNIFHGKPLISAYELQDQLHYYGIVADHHIDAFIKNSNDILPDESFVWLKSMETPFKNGKAIHRNFDLSRCGEVSALPFYETVSGATRKYVDNTIAMMKEMGCKLT